MLCFHAFDTSFVGHSELESWELCADASNSVSSTLSVNSSNHSGRSLTNGPFASRLSSLFSFLFCVFWIDLHHLRAAISSLRFNTGLEDEVDESCGGDVEDESLPELVDNPGTTRGTKLRVLHIIVFCSLVHLGSHRSIRGLRRIFQAIEPKAFL